MQPGNRNLVQPCGYDESCDRTKEDSVSPCVAIYAITTQGENIPPSNGGCFPDARIRPRTRIASGFSKSRISSLLTHTINMGQLFPGGICANRRGTYCGRFHSGFQHVHCNWVGRTFADFL